MTHTNGCFDRLPFVARRVVPDGHWTDGHAITSKAVSISNFSHGAACQYSLDTLVGSKDPGCTGCKHKYLSTEGKV